MDKFWRFSGQRAPRRDKVGNVHADSGLNGGRSRNGRLMAPVLAVLLLSLTLGQVLAKVIIGGDGGGGSYVVYCWDGSSPDLSGCPAKPSLAIDATFTTSYSRTSYWTIITETDANYGGNFGENWSHEYVISVDKTHSIDRRTVEGTILIENGSTHTASISGVRNEIDGAALASVDCGVTFPYALSGGQDLTCSFSVDLESATATNTAYVSTTGNVLGNSDSAPITFPGSPTLINDEIDVQDSNAHSWQFSDDATVSYEEDFDCFSASITTNTATIAQTGQSDSATVSVSCIGDTSGLLIIDNYTYPAGGLDFDYLVDPEFVEVDTTYGDPSPGRAVAAGPNGSMYILTDDYRVLAYRFDEAEVSWVYNGEFAINAGSGFDELSNPMDIAVDVTGNFYLADYGNNRIQVFDYSGGHLGAIGGPGSGKGQFNGPTGLAFDAAGNLYVADSAHDRIQVFDSGSNFVEMWGKDVLAGNAETGYEVCTAAPADTCQGNNQGSGNGEFYAPFDVAVDGANVYVAELGNARVQKFTTDGAYLMQWGSYGTGDNQFDALGSLAVDQNGAVYTVEYNNHRIQKFSANGDHIVTWGGATSLDYGDEFFQPTGIAFEPLGYGFVVDQNGDAVKTFFAHGARLDDGENAVFEFVEGREYTVYPFLPDDWSWDYIDCDFPFVDLGDGISINIGPGDIITCDFGHESDEPAEDVDGVPDDVEDGAPNGGDGNNDGIPDSVQNNVTSLPNSENGDYVTVVTEPKNGLQRVENAQSGTIVVPPPLGAHLTTGVHVVEMKLGAKPIRSLTPSSPPAAVITLYFDHHPKFDSYYKFGPTPDNPTPHWYEFLYDGQTGVEILGDRIVVHLVDGGRGDDDLMVNGEIVDPGGPVVIEDAELTIVKEVAGDVPDDWSFDFTGHLSAFSLTDDDPDVTYANLTPGDVAVTETDLPGWVPSVSCLPGGESGTNSVTVALDANENATCRFVNTICDAGTYDNGSACVNASPGYYTQNPGSVIAEMCPPGSYQPNAGQPGCFEAEEGYYVDIGGAIEQTACPGDTTSPAGSDSAADCVPITSDPVEVFMSATAAGTTGDGLAFGSEDILKWDGTEWSLWFDGSADGLTANKAIHNINAFWIPDPDGEEFIFAFAQNRRHVRDLVAPVDGMDLLRWDGSAFSLYFDGSDVQLTNLGQEKIDALHILPGSAWTATADDCLEYILISTRGPGKVPNYSGGQIKFGGEDVLGFCATSLGSTTAGKWHMVLDGSAEGMPRNSTSSISVSDDGQTMYLTTAGVFNVDTAAGGHSMVYAYDFDTDTFSGPFFKAADEGLPKQVDGLDVATLPD